MEVRLQGRLIEVVRTFCSAYRMVDLGYFLLLASQQGGLSGADPRFLLGGVHHYFNTNKPHRVFFLQNTSCIRTSHLRGGECAHLHPPPRSAPDYHEKKTFKRTNHTIFVYHVRKVSSTYKVTSSYQTRHVMRSRITLRMEIITQKTIHLAELCDSISFDRKISTGHNQEIKVG